MPGSENRGKFRFLDVMTAVGAIEIDKSSDFTVGVVGTVLAKISDRPVVIPELGSSQNWSEEDLDRILCLTENAASGIVERF